MDIYEIIGLLLYATFASFIYGLGYYFNSNTAKDMFGQDIKQFDTEFDLRALTKRVLKGLLAIITIAAVVAFVFSGQSQSCTDADPVYGGGQDCETTGEPYKNVQERIGVFTSISLLVGLPFLAGANSKYKAIKSGRAKENYEWELRRHKENEEALNKKTAEYIKEMDKIQKGK